MMCPSMNLLMQLLGSVRKTTPIFEVRRRGWRRLLTRTGRRGSFRLDVGLANDAAVFVILFANKSAKFRAALTDRKEPLGDELPLGFGCLECRDKQPGELGDCFFRRLCRRE